MGLRVVFDQRYLLLVLVSLLIYPVWNDASQAAETTIKTKLHSIRIQTITASLDHPWGLAFLPDNRFLVTERSGRLRIVTADGVLSDPISGLPDIRDEGQGGLLDIALGSDFSESGLVFFTYSEPGPDGSSTALARARLDLTSMSLNEVKVLFSQQPKSAGGRHYGSRIVLARDGSIFITTGDRGQRDRVQNPKINRGQVIRLKQDGTIPSDNPFVGVPSHRPEVWSLGHRNPQGATLHPTTGELWTVEHGARGGDEINIPRAGRNYGWPVISYGHHYSGQSIGEGTHKVGMEQPIYYWDPSIAPSGMTFYAGDVFPGWKGNLFVGALRDQVLVRLSVSGEQIVDEERILTELEERIRDVRQGPNGYLYILTDSPNGKLIRLTPDP
jgi:glucose/arabinose dehydrogenase